MQLLSERRIEKLDETVVNRIAAGEVVHQPAHALKELLENSIDAGATLVSITAREGGVKLLQIVDNGCGIHLEDMSIVCERFTTSKLRNFDEISAVTTYGFRGEALASISHVAHVTITTKTKDAMCAYRAHYSDGKLAPSSQGQSVDPKPCAGNLGTTIVAEDLFYNVPTRLKTMRSASEEYAKIVDVVSRYAVHNEGVAFTVKKHGSASVDVNTSASATTLNNIRTIYGATLAKELLEVNITSEQLDFEAKAWASNANWSTRKMGWILFINHRAVESNNLKRAIDAIYAEYLPKGNHPWIYLSLLIKPQNVDVNVHPTKKEVRYLHEDGIIAFITNAIQERLASASHSRTFNTQQLISGQQLVIPFTPENDGSSSATATARVTKQTHDKDSDEQTQTFINNTPFSGTENRSILSKQKSYDYQLVRTDSKSRTLERFGFSLQTPDKEQTEMPLPPKSVEVPEDGQLNWLSQQVGSGQQEPSNVGTVSVVPRREIRLTSVLQLRVTCEERVHSDLRDIIRHHTFVGCVDGVFALIQHQTKLYVVNYQEMSIPLFYQLALHEFANFGNIMLSEPAPISTLVLLALEEEEISDWDSSMMPKADIAKVITETIISRREMLFDYFSMRITNTGELLSLPLLWKDYVPNIDKLPLFLLRLGTEVVWDIEKECFDTICFEIALLYAPLPPITETSKDTQGDVSSVVQENNGETKSDTIESQPTLSSIPSDNSQAPTQSQGNKEMEKYNSMIEHVLFGQLMRWNEFYPSRELLDECHIVQIANLHELYKVFERC